MYIPSGGSHRSVKVILLCYNKIDSCWTFWKKMCKMRQNSNNLRIFWIFGQLSESYDLKKILITKRFFFCNFTIHIQYITFKSMILVQFPNSVPVIVNLDLTLNFVTLIGRPQCNGRFCWQASLLHLRPSFSSTRMITRTIYVQDLSSGTVLYTLDTLL